VHIIHKNYQYLSTYFPDRKINLFVVNDGSKHNFTCIEIDELKSLNRDTRIISYPSNRGKGYALRKAVALTSSPFIIYTDYDFPFRTGSMIKVIEELDKGADIVLVSRNHDYVRALTPMRKFYSSMSKRLNKHLLKMEYFETQGGLKGFNARGKEIFLKTTIDEFLFDTEFIYRASLQKDITIINVDGVTRENLKPNKVPIRVVKKEVVNFFRILRIKN